MRKYHEINVGKQDISFIALFIHAKRNRYIHVIKRMKKKKIARKKMQINQWPYFVRYPEFIFIVSFSNSFRFEIVSNLNWCDCVRYEANFFQIFSISWLNFLWMCWSFFFLSLIYLIYFMNTLKTKIRTLMALSHLSLFPIRAFRSAISFVCYVCVCVLA